MEQNKRKRQYTNDSWTYQWKKNIFIFRMHSEHGSYPYFPLVLGQIIVMIWWYSKTGESAYHGAQYTDCIRQDAAAKKRKTIQSRFACVLRGKMCFLMWVDSLCYTLDSNDVNPGWNLSMITQYYYSMKHQNDCFLRKIDETR